MAAAASDPPPTNTVGSGLSPADATASDPLPADTAVPGFRSADATAPGSSPVDATSPRSPPAGAAVQLPLSLVPLAGRRFENFESPPENAELVDAVRRVAVERTPSGC